MAFKQELSRRKLKRFDRAAIFLFEGHRAIFLPGLLLILPAIWLWQKSGNSLLAGAILLVATAAGLCLTVMLFMRAIRVQRNEMRHWHHMERFWARKWKSGLSLQTWLLMFLQVSILLAFGYWAALTRP